MDNYKRANGKIQIIRWGEVHLALIKKLPTGLKKAKTDVVMTGSSNNPHIVKNCDIYFKKESDFVFGYLRARKGAKLTVEDEIVVFFDVLPNSPYTAKAIEVEKKEIQSTIKKPVVFA